MKPTHQQPNVQKPIDYEDESLELQNLIDINEMLQKQIQNMNLEITNYKNVLFEKNKLIEQLMLEISQLKLELKFVSKSNEEDLLSTISLDRYKHITSTLQPKRKRIFETKKTTLHMNHLSPKKNNQDLDEVISPDVGERRQKKYSEDEVHQVIVQEVQVQEYPEHPDIPLSKVDEIILKYSKPKQESQIKLIQIESTPNIQLKVEQQQIKNDQILEKNKLFEDFLIISVSKRTLNNLQKNILEEKEVIVVPEILFQHSSDNKNCQEQIQLLLSQIHPYGLKVKLEEKTLSMSNLNSILMGGQSYDRLAGVYVIPMKSEQYFNAPQKVVQQYNNTNLDNIQDLITYTNIHHQIYCICIDVPDFYDFNICEPKPNKLQRKYFYSLQKTYCFITKAPIIDFFIEIIKIIINTLKYKKAEIYSMVTEIEETLINIDNQFYTSFKPELFEFLTQIQNVQYLSQCSFSFLQTPIHKCYLRQQEREYYEIEWAISYAFSHMDLPHFLILVINMLLEHNICIVSSNRTLLSALLMLLPQTISPFQYIHPTIFSLTNQLMPMLDSPVPFICGMLKDTEHGLQRLGIDDDCTFFESQSEVLFFDVNKLKFYNTKQNYSETKIYTNLFYRLFQTYQLIKEQNMPGQCLPENNESIINYGFDILKKTKEYIENNILSTIQDENYELDILIEKAINQTDDDTIKHIYKTQSCSYYLQQKYCNNK